MMRVVNIGDEVRVSAKRTQSPGEELANSISHGIGLCAALIGAPILLLEARRSTPGFFLGTVIFVVTMSVLYLGSTLYHAWPQTRGKSILRVLDHSAFFCSSQGHIRRSRWVRFAASVARLFLESFGRSRFLASS